MLKSTIGFLCLGMIAVLSMSNVGGRAKQGGEGNTGAPGDKSYNCSNCHGGGAYNVNTKIELKDASGAVVTHYKPDSTYQLSFSFTTVSGTAPKGYGFQLVALIDDGNVNAGTMTNPSADAQIISKNNRSYFEHKKASLGSTFTTEWKAPSEGTGAVTFYGVGNANNTNSGTSGDVIETAPSLNVSEAVAGSNKVTISKLFLFPNPVSDKLSWNQPLNASDLTYVIENMSGQKFELGSQDVIRQNYDVSRLAPGVYILKAVNSNGSVAAANSFIKI